MKTKIQSESSTDYIRYINIIYDVCYTLFPDMPKDVLILMRDSSIEKTHIMFNSLPRDIESINKLKDSIILAMECVNNTEAEMCIDETDV